MNFKCLFKLILFSQFLFGFSIYAQENETTHFFRSPLDIPIKLSGNFAELRNNHFHGGLDIRTEGVEGKKVYAVADGYVSRIKITAYGYGKVIYITHPNHIVSVYAHLRNFNDSIANYTRAAQYTGETFELELYPDSNALRVKKGDVIAFSGNTGSSRGPHLHFELRDAVTENTINPFLYGFNLKDHAKPKIKSLSIFPQNDSSTVNCSFDIFQTPVTGADGKYTVPSEQIVEVSGNIGFGVNAVDIIDGSFSNFGVYSLEVFVDTQLIYAHKMDEVSFFQTRSINSFIDYEAYKKKGTRIQQAFVAPNNPLNIYTQLKNRGIYTFSDDTLHEVNIVVKDFAGNTSFLSFKVRSSSECVKKEFSPPSKLMLSFNYNENNVFDAGDFKMNIPDHVFYANLQFEYDFSEGDDKLFSKIHHIHNEYTPVNSLFNIYIKPFEMTDFQKNKAVIVNITEKRRIIPMESTFTGDFLKTQIINLGDYAVMIDSTAPYIKPVNLYHGKNMSAQKQIRLKIFDNLSGIKSYKGYIDGKWVLMEYDMKTGLLTYDFEKNIHPGKHLFVLTVTDNKENSETYRAIFTR